MDTIFWAVVAILMVLGVVTLVGHGIWVMLAALFGQRKWPTRAQGCVFCGRSTYGTKRCDWCGRDLTTALAAELADLDVVKRQLMRFRSSGTLTPQAVDRLLERLDNYRKRLLTPQQPLPVAMPAVAPQAAASPPEPLVLPTLPPLTAPQAVAEAIIELVPVEIVAVVGAKPPAVVAAQQAPPAPLEPPPAPVRTAPPPAPRKSWTEILAAFMEERNIHWGELIGGLLIVCSSTALVVSLWEHLKTIPYFQFFIFVTITSAIFGVGLYAHHRWKLASTSHGILVIATLLVPLNFAAMAGMSQGTWTPLALVPQVISLAIFAGLVMLAARVIAADARTWLALAVLGNSAAMLATVPLISPAASAGRFLATGVFCTGLFAVAVLGHLYGLAHNSRTPRLDAAQCNSLFALLGIAAFAMAVAVGLLIVHVASRAELVALLHRCSLLAALVALPVLAAGLTIQRRALRDSSLESYRLAGTTVALVALAGMLAAVGLAWPHPHWIMAVCLFDAVVLAWAAFRWRMPMLHAGAISCAALAYLTAFHLVAGDLQVSADAVTSIDMLKWTLSARSGTALGVLFVVLAVISEWLARRGYRRHGAYYLGGCAMAAAAGLVLATFHGLWHGGADALRAAILYGVYGLGSLALAARWRRVEFSYLGLFLLAAVLPWGFAWHAATRVFGPHWGLLLAAEGLAMAATTFTINRLRVGEIYRTPLSLLAEAIAALALVLVVAAGIWTDPWKSIIAATCLAATCFLMAEFYASPWRTSAGQTLLSVAALLGAALWLKHAQWIVGLEQIVDDSRNLQVCGIALALLSLAWVVLRIVAARVGWDKLAERAPAHHCAGFGGPALASSLVPHYGVFVPQRPL